MKLVFLSNWFNHHQAALSDALWRETEGQYLFVETQPMPREQAQLGYPWLQRSYVVPLSGNEETVLQAIREADGVIAGSAPEWLIQKRIQSGKLLFRYAERPLRNGLEPLKYLPRLLRWHWRNPGSKPIYLLCASGYTAGDYGKFGLFRGKAFCWGYFPAFQPQEEAVLFSRKRTAEILWCGRFLELKHPEAALHAALRLKQAGYAFVLNFLGSGEKEPALHREAEGLGLGDCIRFLGPQPAEQVRREMEQAGIFLFTSDRREGWGVVLNEAMNSGCAVIASHAIGSVPFLLKHGENGLVYPSGEDAALFDCLRYLLDHPEQQRRLGAAAYRTIREGWTAELAARRLMVLTKALLEGKNGQDLFSEGPCSPAEKRNEDWFS